LLVNSLGLGRGACFLGSNFASIDGVETKEGPMIWIAAIALAAVGFGWMKVPKKRKFPNYVPE
jgi:hypothetical protein